MKKHHAVILLVAMAITALLEVHEYLYDPVHGLYPVSSIVKDIVFAGSMYTVIFYVVIFAFYSWCRDSRHPKAN